MGKKISRAKAKKLFDNWVSEKGPGKAITDAGFIDTFESWFSAEELRDYCQEVIDTIGEANNPGIRIYFGSYGKDAGPKDKRSTVFLAPTKGGNKNYGMDEDSLEPEPENNDDLEPYNSGGTRIPPAGYEPKP